MKVGDLVEVRGDTCESGHQCGCWFCSNNSSRVGVIIKKHRPARSPLENLATNSSEAAGGYWTVLFNAGDCWLYGTELEVINEIL